MSFQDDKSKSESHNSFKINEEFDGSVSQSSIIERSKKDESDTAVQKVKGRIWRVINRVILDNVKTSEDKNSTFLSIRNISNPPQILLPDEQLHDIKKENELCDGIVYDIKIIDIEERSSMSYQRSSSSSKDKSVDTDDLISDIKNYINEDS